MGIALATGPIAEPLVTLNFNTATQLLKKLIKEHNIDEIVVGDCPDKFLNQLVSLGLSVHRQDETLSTYDATQALLHTSQKRRHKSEHAAAAALILQNWLDASTDAQHQS